MSAKIAKALHEVMSKVGYVQKTKKSPIGYKYAGEAAVLEALRPAMVEAGLLLLPCVTKLSDVDAHGNTHVIVEYTLAHKDGDIWPHKIAMAGSGNDRNKAGVSDKGVYKAITGANKYLLYKLFQIETGDDPERDEMPEPRDQVPDISATARQMMTSIDQCDTVRALDNYAETTLKTAITKLPTTDADLVRTRFGQRKSALKSAEHLAA
jgi:hypothetical protein